MNKDENENRITKMIIEEVLEDEFDFIEGIKSIEMDNSSIIEDIKTGRTVQKSNTFFLNNAKSDINCISPKRTFKRATFKGFNSEIHETKKFGSPSPDFKGRRNFIRNISKIEENQIPIFRNESKYSTQTSFDQKFQGNYSESSLSNPFAFHEMSTALSFSKMNILEGSLIKNEIERSKQKVFSTLHLESEKAFFTGLNDENFELFKGKIIESIKGHKGSRLFQDLIKNSDVKFISSIFEEIEDQLDVLIYDPYANYFCHKLFYCLNQSQKTRFLEKIKDSIVTASCDKFGTHALQRVIENIDKQEDKQIIVQAISYQDFYDMSVNDYGIHVIEKILTCFSEDLIQHTYKFMNLNFMIFALNKNSIGAVKRMVMNLKSSQNILETKHLIIINFIQLIYNEYGNYIIQAVLENWTIEHKQEIICLFYSRFYEFSLNKFASNAVEKCIEFGGEISLTQFLNEINYKNRTLDLMRSSFGNFVIQKAIKVSKNQYLNYLSTIILSNLNRLNDNRMIIKWMTLLSEVKNY